MRSVTYSMGVSLDGYIAGPDGDFGWTVPDEEVFSFVTDEIREADVHLLGRRLFPQRERRVDLELAETRTFSSRVVYLRYRVAR